MARRKRSKAGWIAFGLLAVVVVGILFWRGAEAPVSVAGVGGELAVGEGVRPLAPCDKEDISLKYAEVRKDKEGTSGGERMYLITDRIGALADAGSITVPTNWEFSGIAGENSSTYYSALCPGANCFVNNKNNFANSNCADPTRVVAKLAYMDSTPTDFITNDDGTLNSASALSIDAGESVTVSLNIKSTSEQYFSNPECNKAMACFVYNGSDIGSVVIQGVQKVSTPSFFTYVEDTANGLNSTDANADIDCYEIDAITSTPKIYQVEFKAKTGTTNPSEDATVIYLDADHDKDEDSLAILECVYEDEDGNDLGLTTSYTNQATTVDLS